MSGTLQLKMGRGTLTVPWTRVDRAIQAIAPTWAAKRLQARVGHELMAYTGGSYNGASKSRRSLAGWRPGSADADADTLGDLPDLRARSADLERNSPVAGGAINTHVTHTVGTGLALKSSIDAELLGLTPDEADAWQVDTERKFNAWWESSDVDVARHCNGYALQALALRGEAARGDAFAILTTAEHVRGPVKLAVQLLEGDRCCNPDRKPDTATLVAGVEQTPEGAPVRYHFASGHPERRSGAGALRKLEWRAVDAFGERTGARQVLHIMHRTRPGQTRGIPLLAPVIEPLKQLERYTEAELMAAVVSGMFTVFIKSEGNAGAAAMPNAMTPGQTSAPQGGAGGWDGKLGNGLVVELGDNEAIETANPGRPNAQFDPFVTAIVRQIGLVLEIPYEVLVKHYQSSYSAARAALLDAWRAFRVRRDRFIALFCQPIYEAWLDEAVAVGYVSAPGYFANNLVRRAWLGAEWIGDGPGSIDPVKEVEGAERRVALGISTREAESLLHDGRPLRGKIRQLLREQTLMAGLIKPAPAPKSSAPAPDPQQPE